MKDHEYKSPFVRRVAFYCQKVLPLVFDNSLSYYESLAHFAHKLNETIDGLNKQSMQIVEFEKELALALDTFENELRQAQTDFETRIETEWSNFRADISRWQTELEGDWEVMKSELETVEQLIQEKQLELEADYTQYKADLTAQQTAFETAQTARQQAFETAQTTRQQTFENAQTTRQTNFENEQTARQDAFEEEITGELENYSTTQYSPYMGAFSGIQVDPPTISSLGNSPIDFDGLICSVFYKSPDSDSFEFVKRINYQNILFDSDIPSWDPANFSSTAFIVVFENPVVSEWIKAGITIYGNAEAISGIRTPRMVIRKFPEITNNKITLADSVLEGTYTFGGGISPTDYAGYTVEEPMTAAPPYWYTAFCFYDGAKRLIETITQPSGATTKVFPGYVYDAFRGGVVRDPKFDEVDFQLARRIPSTMGDAIVDPDPNSGIYANLFDLTVGKYNRQANANLVQNIPADLGNTPFYCEVVNTISNLRRQIKLYPCTAATAGNFYICLETANGFGSWYKFTGTVVT